jgi:hypothetical protein
MFDPAGPVLGIDPGLSRCGYGIVARIAGDIRALGCGVIRTARRRPDRLLALDVTARLIARRGRRRRGRASVVPGQRPNGDVGRAGGGLALVARRAGIPVALYSPNEVKLAVTGGRGRQGRGASDGRTLAEPARGLTGRRGRRSRRATSGARRSSEGRAATTPCNQRHRAQREGEVLVEVGGVGYRLNVPLR